MTDETKPNGDAAAQAAAAAAAAAAGAQQTPEQKAAADAAAAAAAAQTPEQKAAAEKAAAEKAAADAKAGKPPEKYEFKLPDGVTLAPEMLTGLEGFAKKNALSADAANELATFAASQVQAVQAKAAQLSADWKAAAEKDPEIGGDKLPAALAASAKVLGTFGNAEFKAYLNESGLGNHPEMIRAFSRIAAAISEDKFVPGGRAPEPKGDARSQYPNSNMNP